MSKPTREKIVKLLQELDAARSAVFVCATALNTGDDHTDLETQIGKTLQRAYKEIEGVYDGLLFMQHDVPSQSESPPAAQALRQAIAATEAALEAAADGSDDEARCNEALESMESDLSLVEGVR